MKRKSKNKALQQAIDIIGNQTKLAKKLKCSQQSISHWLVKRIKLPLEKAIEIEKLTNGKVTREQLRPDLYKK